MPVTGTAQLKACDRVLRSFKSIDAARSERELCSSWPEKCVDLCVPLLGRTAVFVCDRRVWDEWSAGPGDSRVPM